MIQYTGLGIVMGFLVNRQLLTHQIQEKYSQNQEMDWNVVTGQKEENALTKELHDMTDEEKEVEAEKLFVLFERMNKLGINVELQKDTS